MLWVPKGLVVGIVGVALDVRAEFSAKYNFFTCDPLFVEVRCLIFIRRSFFFPTIGEDVDDASVVHCHFRQVCVGAEEQGHSVGNVSSSHTCDITKADLEFDLCVFSMELGNHIDETTSGKSPSGLLSESYTRAVEDRADARHCGVSSMRAQAKNQIAQFLPNPGRRIQGGAIRNVGNICLRIRFRSHAHDVCSSKAGVSPCGNPPFPCASKCGCSW